MLSVVDLLDAGTLTAQQAAYALAVISKGSSFMVGALPGGAGKTTVMCALLNLVPPDVKLAPADGITAINSGLNTPVPRCCYICHEIGRGAYYAYLWGHKLRAFFELPNAGHMIATNLHADTFEQARSQVCDDNGISPEKFVRMNIIFFLSVNRQLSCTSRKIVSIWESNGETPHTPVCDGEGELDIKRSIRVSEQELRMAEQEIKKLLGSGAQTIQEVRSFVLNKSKL